MYYNFNFARDFGEDLENSCLVYLHPQRTGGTKLKSQLYTWFGRESCYTQQTVKDGFKDWKYIEEDDLSGVTVYAHHSDFWKKNFGIKCYYMATVRHPVYRLFSFYNYCKSKEGHPLREMANGLTPEEFLIEAEKVQPKSIRDFQTLRLSRKRDASKAISNIENYIVGVSETDKLSEFSNMLSTTLDLPGVVVDPVEKDCNIYKGRVSDQFVNLALDFNNEDLKLFEWVEGGKK